MDPKEQQKDYYKEGNSFKKQQIPLYFNVFEVLNKDLYKNRSGQQNNLSPDEYKELKEKAIILTGLIFYEHKVLFDNYYKIEHFREYHESYSNDKQVSYADNAMYREVFDKWL